MGDPVDRITRADREAADWFAKLGSRSISNEALGQFEAWRRESANVAAYNRIERVWQSAGRLTGDADIQRAAKDALRRPPAKRVSMARPLVLGGLAIASVAIVSLAIWQTSARTTFSTGVGEQRPITLADGTSVRLDTNSAMRVRYARGTRTVILDRGQAFFDVISDPDRPFIVEAGETSVVALGTSFDVRRDDGTVEVTLVSGSVEVKADNPTGPGIWRLKPGNQVKVASQGAEILNVDSATEISWTEGELIFRDQPLNEAVAEVNRYLLQPITLDADTVSNVRVNGVFKTGDRDAFVAAATDLFDLRATPQADGSILLVQAQPK